MKLTPVAALLAVAALVAGCATSQPQLVLDPIGPPLPYSTTGGSQGTLMVFSALDITADFNANPYRHRYTDYSILSANGQQLIKTVHNDKGILSEGPRKVGLPVGTYRIVARANGYGDVTVPVVICTGQLTTVHLEGSPWWPNPSEIANSNPVRLPHGEIAGWRATTNATPNP